MFHCPFCHGWEMRDRPLGVLDRGAAGARRALLLRFWSDDVTLLADGPAELDPEDGARLRAAGVAVDERRVAGLRGPGETLTAVVFDDGAERACEGLLVPVTLHQRSALAERLGAALAAPGPVVAEAVEVDRGPPHGRARPLGRRRRDRADALGGQRRRRGLERRRDDRARPHGGGPRAHAALTSPSSASARPRRSGSSLAGPGSDRCPARLIQALVSPSSRARGDVVEAARGDVHVGGAVGARDGEEPLPVGVGRLVGAHVLRHHDLVEGDAEGPLRRRDVLAVAVREHGQPPAAPAQLLQLVRHLGERAPRGERPREGPLLPRRQRNAGLPRSPRERERHDLGIAQVRAGLDLGLGGVVAREELRGPLGAGQALELGPDAAVPVDQGAVAVEGRPARHAPRFAVGALTRSAGRTYGRALATLETVHSADGTPIAAWRSGGGPPLVLLHGTAADHARWRPVLPAFEERFTVLAADRRGRGASGDARGWAIEREFEDVAALAALGGEGTCLLGHSFGAICALQGAPLVTSLRALVLYEPPVAAGVASDEVIARLEELLEAGDRDRLMAFFMAEVAGVAEDQIEVMRAQPAWEARLAAAPTIPRELRAANEQRFDPAAFEGLDVPTLVLRGGASRPSFMEAAATVAAGLPDARLVTMPGQGHTAMDTATELFVSEVLGFLAPLAPPRD